MVLNPVRLPHADSVETDESLAAAIHYEDSLRRIVTYDGNYSDGAPGHEVSHTLMAELPDLTEKALCHTDKTGPGEPEDPAAEVGNFNEGSIPS